MSFPKSRLIMKTLYSRRNKKKLSGEVPCNYLTPRGFLFFGRNVDMSKVRADY